MLDTVEVFNVATNTWSPGPFPLPAAVKYPAGAVGPNGPIYAIGGADAKLDYIADVYSYDPTAPGRAKRPPMSGGRAALAADTGPDGLVYAIGGVSPPPGSGTVLAYVEAYTVDKCDYIEYQIGIVDNEIADELNLLDAPELSPKQRAAVLKQIAGLRAQLKNLLAQLKTCQGQ